MKKKLYLNPKHKDHHTIKNKKEREGKGGDHVHSGLSIFSIKF